MSDDAAAADAHKHMVINFKALYASVRVSELWVFLAGEKYWRLEPGRLNCEIETDGRG
jgi:hypothetical protein